MVSAFIAWVFLSLFSTKADSDATTTKSEPVDSDVFDPFSTEDHSDDTRPFPTLGRQMHFTRRDGIKEEDVKEEPEEKGGIPFVAEADDEDDEMEAAWRDSGVGTSLDDGDRSSVYQRRLYGVGK